MQNLAAIVPPPELDPETFAQFVSDYLTKSAAVDALQVDLTAADQQNTQLRHCILTLADAVVPRIYEVSLEDKEKRRDFLLRAGANPDDVGNPGSLAAILIAGNIMTEQQFAEALNYNGDAARIDRRARDLVRQILLHLCTIFAAAIYVLLPSVVWLIVTLAVAIAVLSLYPLFRELYIK